MSSFTCGGCCSSCQEASVGALYDTQIAWSSRPLFQQSYAPPSSAVQETNPPWSPRPILQQKAAMPGTTPRIYRQMYEQAARATQALISEFNAMVRVAHDNPTAADTTAMRSLAARLVMAALRSQAQILRQLAQEIDDERARRAAPEVRLTAGGRVLCQDPSGQCAFYYVPPSASGQRTWQVFYLPNGTEATVISSPSGGSTQVRVIRSFDRPNQFWGEGIDAFVKTSSLRAAP